MKPVRLASQLAGLAAASLLLSGCPARQVAKIDPAQQKAEQKEIPISINRDVDILFVIDNSGSMEDEQESLAANFPQFVNVLEQIEGGLPNVHIGVVSTNVGVSGQIIPGCEGAGDNGRLQNTPRVPAGSPAGTAPSCSGPQGNFIRDVALESGERDRNFTGTLSETFSCIAQLGIKGCGFEQPLEAAHRALNNTNIENAMFLRPDAFLAIILITDEDDCSAKSPQLFDPNQDSIESQLGFLQSYRCYEFGIRCDGQRLDRTPKSYENCEPLTGDDALCRIRTSTPTSSRV